MYTYVPQLRLRADLGTRGMDLDSRAPLPCTKINFLSGCILTAKEWTLTPGNHEPT